MQLEADFTSSLKKKTVFTYSLVVCVQAEYTTLIHYVGKHFLDSSEYLKMLNNIIEAAFSLIMIMIIILVAK